MWKRALLLSSIIIPSFGISALGLIAACGSSDSGGPGGDAGGDATGDARPRPDSPSGDSGVVVPPTGTQIVKTGNLLAIYGVTSDGFVIYQDTTNNTVYSVPLAGGNPTMITVTGQQPVIGVNGNVAFVFANQGANPTTPTDLKVWTQAHGTVEISSSAEIAIAVAKDGSALAYYDGFSGGHARANIVGVDGKNPTVVVPEVDLQPTDQSCAPSLAWANTTAILGYCAPAAPPDAGAEGGGPDAGATDGGDAGGLPKQHGTITIFTAPTWTAKTVSTAAFAGAFAGTTDGAEVLYFDDNGLNVFNVAGGTTTNIDKQGDAFIVSPDNKKVVFGTAVGMMPGPFRSSPIAAPAITDLVTAGTLVAPVGISPDGNYVLAYGKQSQPPCIAMQQTLNDVYLVSTTAAGTPNKVGPDPTGAILGDSFTTDSKYALFYQGVCIVQKVGTAGTLSAVAVSGGGTPMPLGMNVWEDLAASGSKVVFNPNWVAPTGLGLGLADLEVADLSAGGTPKVLVTQADANFFISPDKTKIVYSFSSNAGETTGLWVMPVP